MMTEKNDETAVSCEQFKLRYGISLNRQQDLAVQTVEGPVLLLAVPGSGKTTVLVSRLGYMIYVKKIPPEKILTVTYTVAATRDMKRRFENLFGEEYGNRLEFRTINGICQKILNFYGQCIGKSVFDVADRECNEIIKLVFRKINDSFATENDIKEISTAISYVKNMRLNKEQLEELDTEVDCFPEIYRAYNAELKRRNLIDYDDQMVYALVILERNPGVLKHFQDCYPYICVDEAQDTSKIQYDLIHLLASATHNLFMVGDEDQSIYGFRAAYPQGLLNFEQIYPEAKVLLMESNFRSREEIVRKADTFIQKNMYRHKKQMTAAREPGGTVKNIEVDSRKNQYSFLLNVAEHCEKSTAVLYRNNESAIPLIDLLEKKKIPFQMKKTEMVFFSHPVVLDLTDILQFALHPSDGELFLKIYYKIGTGLKKGYAQRLAEGDGENTPILVLASESAGIPVYAKKACRKAGRELNSLLQETAGAAVYRILHSLGYQKYMDSRNMDSSKADIVQMVAGNCGSIESFLNRMQELQEMTAEGVGDPHAKFILSTIHSSKGLEYDTVYLMDMVKGILPSEGVPKSTAAENKKMLYEEERRLFYVAMTRAKNELYVFTFKSEKNSNFSNELFYAKPSRDTKVKKAEATNPSPKGYGFKDIYSKEKTEELKMNFEQGIIVRHRTYGKGVIVMRNDDKIEVSFDNGKSMPMSLDFVVRKGLLKTMEE